MVLDANIMYRDAFILVFDVTDTESLDKLKNFMERIDRYHKGAAPIVIVGNKIDKESERKISSEDAKAKAMALRPDIEYIECSALTGQNIDEVFACCVKLLKAKESISKAETAAKSVKKKVPSQASEHQSCCFCNKEKCAIF